MFWTEIFIWGMVICVIMAIYLVIKAGKLSTMIDDLRDDIDNYKKQFGKLQDINNGLKYEFEEKEKTLVDDIKNLQEKLQEKTEDINKKSEAIVKRDEVITNMQKNSKEDYKKINNLKEEKEEFSQENIAFKKDIRANYIELAKFNKLSEEKKELIKIQKKDTKEIRDEYLIEIKKLHNKYANDFKIKIENHNEDIKNLKESYNKNLEESNILVDTYKKQLKEVSWKINKIVTYIIEENKDEELEWLLDEFDAFYIINACLIKYKRVNENQAIIYRNNRKRHQEREREHKRVKDRLRTISVKYNEPMDIKKCVRNKKKKK